MEATRSSITLTDEPAQLRFSFIVSQGREIFKSSALLDPSLTLTRADLSLIDDFHNKVSPVNPSYPWRLESRKASILNGEIEDVSTFANWESLGGPLEHIRLATDSAPIVIAELNKNLRPDNTLDSDVLRARDEIVKIDPIHSAVVAALHDEGREVTHMLYFNELVGYALLKKIGIRHDLLVVMPGSDVLIIPPGQDIYEVLKSLPAEGVVLRIADEFGKRFPKSNRLYQPDDYLQWAKTYTSRPLSGRHSERWYRDRIELHINNLPRYFQSVDRWISSVSTLTLDQLIQSLNYNLAPTLSPV